MKGPGKVVNIGNPKKTQSSSISQYKNEYVRVSIMKLQAVDPIVVGRRIDLIHRGPVLPIHDLRPP